MTTDPHEDAAVAAAFANLRAASSEQFPPPPVDELIMRGPAALRRRRLVSLAAVLGACTAVTAGGFAVAQTLGPLTGGAGTTGTGAATVTAPASDDSPSASPGDGASPQTDEGAAPTTTPAAPADDLAALIVEGPFEGDWAEPCGSGPQEADFTTWVITAETGWSITAVAEGDADGDGEPDTVLALTCDGRTGVAAFAMQDADDEQVLASFAWVWQPDGDHEATGIAAVEDGSVTVEGTDAADAAWTVHYEWDGEAFVLVEAPATTDPTPTESTTSASPAETPSTDAAAASTSSGS
ncbi:hypothetical protein [Glycomyces paridis]|uniref:Uncharacterized protein n=1 Tax=Glycomyces paridis TaxID=2126555 RepID=A0A4V4HNW0_9ACTN|nr:hypothetical protein [Glycomyces paridis]THV27586.1 hypothetical protein E9998_14360 [Glycomyces paridis]